MGAPSPQLISIDEARERVLAEVRPLPAEDVELPAALGRVLAAAAVADQDLPPFDASAMDGYAVPDGEAGALRIEGESRAGAPASSPLAPGTACRISTGAVVPEGTHAVVPVEATEERDGEVVVPATEPGANVRRAGEDVRAGETVLSAGSGHRARPSLPCWHRSARPRFRVPCARGSPCWRPATSWSSPERSSPPARSGTRTPTPWRRRPRNAGARGRRARPGAGRP